MIRQVSAERQQQAQDTGYQAFQKRLIPGKENTSGRAYAGAAQAGTGDRAQRLAGMAGRSHAGHVVRGNHDPGHCDCDRSHGTE